MPPTSFNWQIIAHNNMFISKGITTAACIYSYFWLTTVLLLLLLHHHLVNLLTNIIIIIVNEYLLLIEFKKYNCENTPKKQNDDEQAKAARAPGQTIH